jgi:hypothetical protein
MHWRRHSISIAIMAFWLFMMTLLVRNHLLPRTTFGEAVEISPAQLTEEWHDYEEWMRLTIGGKSEGVAYTTIRRRPEEAGYVADNRVWLELEVLGAKHNFRLETGASLDQAFCLERALARVRLDEAEMRFVAVIQGRRLYYRWQYEDRTRVGLQRLEQPISLLEAMRPMLTRRLELKVGAVYRMPVLDSTWSLREGLAEVRVVAREPIEIAGKSTDSYRLVVQLGPFASTTWVSPRGEVLRREFAYNIVMERVEPDVMRKRFPGIDAPVEIPPMKPSDFRDPDRRESLPDEDLGPLSVLGDLFRSPAKR